ncbi:MAG: dihydrodipicolinate synthase family protein [Desulfobacterales bacterium]|jgi:4-hydroxy-2-oxoglutarate aldolase|nr:dihydrodipicolinate synthase family protein [Desulfobacterales bacterium]
MKPTDLHGIFPPIPTPFVDGKLACDKLAENIAAWNATGLSGYVTFGSNGEAVYLSDEEKLAVVKTVVQAAAPGMKVIAGTGCESTWQTIELTNRCARLGAHAALVVTPFYYGGRMNEAALLRHFTAVADQAEIPILIYNVTKFTHISVSVNLVAALSQHPNIIGIKDSNGSVSALGEMVSRAAEEFSVLVGTAGALFGALTLGCVGGVVALANVAPKACVRICSLLKKGELEAASKLQIKMLPVNTALTATYGVAGLKAALDMLGYYGGAPRPPLLPATEKEKSEIRDILLTAGLLA